jgi:GntR family transcriptional regulator / MocR family aminotransferase
MDMAAAYDGSGDLRRSNPMPESGTSAAGPELLIELDHGTGPVRSRVETNLRTAIRSGRLASGTRLPSSRTLARDLGVSRRLVVDAYGQLVAEGWLQARQGVGTVVGTVPAGADVAPRQELSVDERPRYDFFPGAPDLSAFPRALWLRAAREVLLHAPDHSLHYPDPAGTPELRTALAGYLARVRGLEVAAEHMLVTTGATQALTLVARALVRAEPGAPPRVAVEFPSLPPHAEAIAATGADVVGVPVDAEGLDVDRLERSGACAVVVTPAHQFPLGMALSPARRVALLEWASAVPGRLVIEDDYDAEFRYDRRPIGALQGRAPEHVMYVGSASKALAPALRLGWAAVPAWMTDAVFHEKRIDDAGSGVLDQLALARLLETAAYDRHIRGARRRNQRRREVLLRELEAALPDATVEGLPAGLHVIVRLPAPVDLGALWDASQRRSVGVYALAAPGDVRADRLVVGYASLSEPALRAGVPLLAAAIVDAQA